MEHAAAVGPWIWTLFGLMAVESVLGVIVLAIGRKSPAAWFLTLYMVAAPASFSLIVIARHHDALGMASLAGGGLLLALGGIVGAFLPALLASFFLTYPTPHVRWTSSWWTRAGPFIVSIGVIIMGSMIKIGTVSVTTTTSAGEIADQQGLGMNGVVVLGLVYFLVVAAVGQVFVRHRARQAVLTTDARRLRFLGRFVSMPLAVASIGALLVIVAVGASALMDVFRGQFPPRLDDGLASVALDVFELAIVPVFLFVPALGAGYAHARYRWVDADLRLRVTVGTGFLGGFFALVFFATSESVEALLEFGTGSRWVGLAAAAAILPFYRPLGRLADRAAGRSVPGTSDEQKYREFRRWEIYRAAYADVTTKGKHAAGTRERLGQLAKRLGLAERETATIEAQVDRERVKGISAAEQGSRADAALPRGST